MNIVMLNEISDDAKLVRFVDETGMRLSVGKVCSDKLCYSFPLQLLSYYKKCEGIAADPNEGSTIIDLGDNRSGRVTTCNDALISCWSVCDDAANPWSSLEDSSFVKNKMQRPYAIITTVGKVKNQIQKILEEINKSYGDEFSSLIMNAIYGRVVYSPAKGIPLSAWNDKTDISKGIDIATIQNIFHKPEQNNHGQRYAAEQECRFALIINARNFNGVSAGQIAKQLAYYSLSGDKSLHYIEKVYACADLSDAYNEISLTDILTNTEIV